MAAASDDNVVESEVDNETWLIIDLNSAQLELGNLDYLYPLALPHH